MTTISKSAQWVFDSLSPSLASMPFVPYLLDIIFIDKHSSKTSEKLVFYR